MPERWDALIVGAGPAGASAARELAVRGLRVLAIDNQPSPGFRLGCAGGTQESILELAQIPLDSLGPRRVDRSYFYFGDETYEVPQPGYVVLPRRQLDGAFVARARDTGATVRFSTRLVALEREPDGFSARVQSPEGEALIAARLVIGADGPNSTVARLTGLPRPGASLLAAAFVMADLHIESSRSLHVVFDARLAGGYAWVFPLARDRANVGACFLPGSSEAGKLARDLTALPLIGRLIGARRPRVLESGGGLIPIGGPLPPEATIADRLLLAGDAAGMVDSIFGEGISPAVRSGQAAGKVAAEALLADSCGALQLASYTELWRQAPHPPHGNMGVFLDAMRKMRPLFYSVFSAAGSPRDRQALLSGQAAP